jgi:hypothetical protein
MPHPRRQCTALANQSTPAPTGKTGRFPAALGVTDGGPPRRLPV